MALQYQLEGAQKAFYEDGSEENFVKVRDLNARYLDNEGLFARSGETGGDDDNSAFFSALLEARGLK